LPVHEPAYRSVVDRFIVTLSTKLPAMQAALGAGDFQELSRLAHWLKGTGGSAGFPVLTSTAESLERAAHAEDDSQIIEILLELTDLSVRITADPPSATMAVGDEGRNPLPSPAAHPAATPARPQDRQEHLSGQRKLATLNAGGIISGKST